MKMKCRAQIYTTGYVRCQEDALDGFTVCFEHISKDALWVEIEDLRHEIERIKCLPELEWAQVISIITQLLAQISRNGQTDIAKQMLEALDKGQTYVSKLRSKLK
jgi:hypothetical protein